MARMLKLKYVRKAILNTTPLLWDSIIAAMDAVKAGEDTGRKVWPKLDIDTLSVTREHCAAWCLA